MTEPDQPPKFILGARYRLCHDDRCPGWIVNRLEGGVHYHPFGRSEEVLGD